PVHAARPLDRGSARAGDRDDRARLQPARRRAAGPPRPPDADPLTGPPEDCGQPEGADASGIRIQGTRSQHAAVAAALAAMSQSRPIRSYSWPPSHSAPVVPRLLTDMSAAKKVPSAWLGTARAARPSVASCGMAVTKATATPSPTADHQPTRP